MKTTVFITIPKESFYKDFIRLSVDEIEELEMCLKAARQAAKDDISPDVDVIITHKERRSQYTLEMSPVLVEEVFSSEDKD